MKTILVIENDKELLENICDFLTKEGYHLLSADDSLSGFEKVMNQMPDLIICDIVLPQINGFDFYRTIQNITCASSIPLIFIAEENETRDIRQGMNMGADDYITKPVDYSELLATINSRMNKMERRQQQTTQDIYDMIDNPMTGAFIYSRNKFDYVNEKCADIFGLTSADLSGRNIDHLILDPDKKNVLQRIDHCFKKAEQSLHLNFQVHHQKGIRKKVEMYACMVRFRDGDALAGYISECD